MFALAAGIGAAGLAAADRPGNRLLATGTALLLLILAALLYYLRVARPIAQLRDRVRTAAAHPPAEAIAVTGPAEMMSLATDVNLLIAETKHHLQARAALAAIAESSADAIFGKTLDGVITSWNTGAREQYGYSGDEIIGHSVAELIPPGCAGELAFMLDRVRRDERINHLETKRRRKDGRTIDVSISVSPVKDAHGAVVGAATVARDITERAQLEAAQRLLEHRLNQAQRMEGLGQLAGGIAHDFNNLLAIISNYAAFAAEATAGQPTVQADIQQVQAAAERAARLTRQLLIVGRRHAVQPQPARLDAIVAGTRELLASTLGPGVELRILSAARPPTIQADLGQIEQVLLNLVINARDAMPGGGILTIETAAAEFGDDVALLHPGASPGRYAKLTVADTGTGISPDVAGHIFEPFFTTKPLGQGTGLGLATVYGIETQAGGTITMDSQEGAGTRFQLCFPAVRASAPPLPPAAVPGARGEGQTVLVVADEPAVLKLTSRILRQNGYRALEAGTYRQALSLASAQDIDLLLTDSVMPEMSGPTLAERVTKMKPGVPVLFMSGYSAELLGPRHASNEEEGFVQKPFTHQALLTKVRSALGAQPGAPPGSG